MDIDFSNPKYGKTAEDYIISAFFRKKVGTWFRALDVVEDGYLTKEDYEALAEGIIRNQADDSKNDEIRAVLSNLFDDVAAHKSDRKGQKVSFQECVENVAETFVPKEVAGKRIQDFARAIFDFIDTDNDQEISPEEHEKYLAVMGGMNSSNLAEVARISFATIDTDKSGTITRDEFIKAHVDYCFECFGDESESVLLYGPLDESWTFAFYYILAMILEGCNWIDIALLIL